MVWMRKRNEQARRDKSGSRDEPVTVWWALSQYKVPFTQILWLTLALNFVCAGIAYFWYYSLPRTTVAANNAIY